MGKSELLKQHQASLPEFTQASAFLENVIRDLIAKAGLKVHSLQARVKTREGLQQKISRPDRNYQTLLDVTDLIAFRVITYSEDVIEPVAQLIEQSFDVDFRDSTNKLRSEDNQRFGYRSLHYVCHLPESALKVAPSLGHSFKFEIQIRTILQHAWAEIEHDIGYKTSEELPGGFRRRFSQISSLLEIADREFVSIRTDLAEYEKSLKKIDLNAAEEVSLDQMSLKSILERKEISSLDEKVSLLLQKPLSKEAFFPDYLVRALRAAGLKKVKSVLEEAVRSEDQFPLFIPSYFQFSEKHWNFGPKSVETIKKGYGLLFVAHLAAIRGESLLINKLDRLARFYHEIDYPDDLEKAKEVARDLVFYLKQNRFIKD